MEGGFPAAGPGPARVLVVLLEGRRAGMCTRDPVPFPVTSLMAPRVRSVKLKRASGLNASRIKAVVSRHGVCVILMYLFLCLNAGNILLNVLIPPNMPCTRTGKNNVLIVCVPNPPIDEKNATVPVTMLIRVKTGEDADELHKILLEKKDA